MATEYSKRTCPGFRGTNVHPGTIVNMSSLRPKEAVFFSLSYPNGASVCLGCGLVARYLRDDGQEQLRQE
jgi:hypothetical protein